MLLRTKSIDRECWILASDCNQSLLVLKLRINRSGKVFLTPQNGSGDDDRVSLVTATSATPQESIESTRTGIKINRGQRIFEGQSLQKLGGGRTFCYRKRKSYADNGIFGAPAGVNPHHVTSCIVRRNTGGPRLVFIWPQKTQTRGRFLNILAPLVHGVLIGLLCMDAIHLWPGEFLPTFLPSTTPPPRLPIKCNIIEPLWFDNT